MHIVVVGLSHRTAPVEVREKLSIPDQLISESLNRLKASSSVLEVSILSTCNRLEIYALVKDDNRVKNMPNPDVTLFRSYASYEFDV